ncbi:MAG: HAMP domain-containing sensor histidine kinase [Acidobacteria bacterium]|nr:HAMP domain-containing sensor histidine kinase [Acidobacteriota bacterium]
MSKTDDKGAIAGEQALVSMLIHELRTPLTALRGSLGLLTEEAKDAAPEVRSFAAIAARNAGKLVSMLDDAADYWRLSDSKAPLPCEPTDIADTVQRALDQVQALVEERGILLDVQATPAEASVNPALVRAAVVRVLSYALSVSPKKAALQVRVDRAKRAGASIVVSVSDGGTAIPADAAARIFEPFSVVARRGAEPARPTGLGLAIARRIVKLHGGSLVFTSNEQGGLFSIKLPVRRPKPRSRRRGKALPE